MVAPQKYLFAVLCSVTLASASDENLLDTRDSALLNGVQNSMTNRQQQIDKMNAQIREHPEHANAARVTSYIQGVDSQIDNAISTVSNALAPLTGGLSVVAGQAVLGPFVQSVTDGAEVFLGNVIGGAADLATNPQTFAALSRSYTNLISQANKYNINTSRLQSVQQQLQNHMTKFN